MRDIIFGPRRADSRRPTYGWDAPRLLVVPVLVTAFGLGQAAITGSIRPLVGVVAILGLLGSSVHSSRRGKFIVWTRLIDGLQLAGDELVLDIGAPTRDLIVGSRLEIYQGGPHALHLTHGPLPDEDVECRKRRFKPGRLTPRRSLRRPPDGTPADR